MPVYLHVYIFRNTIIKANSKYDLSHTNKHLNKYVYVNLTRDFYNRSEVVREES